MRPETVEAMREASQAMVNIEELNMAAGDAIAGMLGAEAALVTGGAAAGLVLQAAACIAGDDPSIVPDVGMFVSADPVAIDQACYDLCCKEAGGFDPFKKAHPRWDPLQQLDYAEQLRLGTRSYTLIRI